MKIGMNKVVEVEAKSILIHVKTRDSLCGEIRDQDNQ